jgi:hypothetical protein
MRIFTKALVYAFGITLAILIGNGLSKCQEKQVPPSGPPTVELKADQQLQLDLLNEQGERAKVEATAAQLRYENARLKFILAIAQFKTALGLSEEYQWNDEQRKFVAIAKNAKAGEQTKQK